MQLITRRTFPFRRYSVGEDGSLLVRVKPQNRDGQISSLIEASTLLRVHRRRYHPYMKPAVRFNTPAHHLSPSSDSDPDRTTPDPDRSITAETLKELIPALVEDCVDLEAICEAYDLNKSVIAALKQAKRQKSRRPSGR